MVSYPSAATTETIRRAYITTGDVAWTSTSGGWTALSGCERDLPAEAGDDVELQASFMWQPISSTADLDFGVLVGSSIVRYSSSGGGSPAAAGEGDPSLYISPATFRTSGHVFGFTVAAGDLDTVNSVKVVRFAVLYKTAAAAGTVYASSNYPFKWRAINRHTVN